MDAQQVLDEAFIQADKAAARRNERWQRQQERQIEERARDLAEEDFDNAGEESWEFMQDVMHGLILLGKTYDAMIRDVMREMRHGKRNAALLAMRSHFVDLRWERFVDRAREDLNI